jgi:hypothetical protein
MFWILTCSFSALIPASVADQERTHALDGDFAKDITSKVGIYSWSQSYWRKADNLLMDVLSSDTGLFYTDGDVFLNVGDYSSYAQIPDTDKLIQLVINLHEFNPTSIVWLTYGDVTEKDSVAVFGFVDTFFSWVSSIPPETAALMGTIGISFDLEHFEPSDTERLLLRCRARREETPFGSTRLLISHTLDGDLNVAGTDVVMRLADSALAMVYANSREALISRIDWLLAEQCRNCLKPNDYKARITLMVEASCKMGKGCREQSFCANPSAEYLRSTLSEVGQFVAAGPGRRLFGESVKWVVHNFEWFVCFHPFNCQFGNCAHFQSYSQSCREY